MYFDLLEKFADRIDKMSGGRLKTDVLPAGAVVKSFEILDAVDKGTVEAGYSSTQFWSGKHPAAYLFSNQPTIGGMDQFGFLAWYYEGDGYKLYDELYRDHLKANVKGFIIGASGGQPLGGFTKPIANLEDLKGLKYRSIPGPASELFKEMGISVVNLRGGEIVPALGRGVIEASEWINPKEHIKLGWPQFGKHYYLQGFHKASELGEIIINKDFWNKLAPDLQEIIKGAARASVAEDIAANIYRNAVALIELQSKYGVKIHDTPQELYTEFLRASDKVVARNSEKNDFFKKVLESQKAFAATVVPYWTKILGMYTYLGEAALKK
jgi:TRAP-type mannitol/chloroaromatic compound transport system substrate-binding protein